MRVIDLREFIRRNGSLPTVVTRTDGTPGAPRKADLMRAALDIEEAHRLGRPPSALAEEPALAPYTPPRRGTVSHLADDDGDDDDDIPNPFQSKSTPPKPKSRRSSFHTPSARAPAEPPSEQPHPAPSADRRKRRASAAWIDPSIFANLSSAKASTASAGEEEIPLPVPDEEPILVEDDDPPPPPPVIDRPAPRPRTPARRSAPRGSPAATDPNVISLGLLHEFAFPDEDDLDDDFDPADDVFVNDPLDDEDERDLDNLLAYNDPLLRTSALADDRRDILVQSDQESGHDSTRETDDELPSDDFSSWDVLKLRRWLKRHNVRYPRDSQKIDLVSLARAHLLHMETSSQAIPVEDDIRPVPKTKSERRKPRLTRRNRTISAPVEDDDDRAESPIDVDAVPSTQANTVHRSRRGRTKSSTKRPVYPRRRLLLSTRVCVLLLGLLLGTSCLWSAYTVYQSHMRPFCDTGALLSKLRDAIYNCKMKTVALLEFHCPEC